MSKKLIIVTLVTGMLFFSMSAYAYDQNAATKFGRGVGNIVSGWIEVPKQIYLTSIHHDPFTGIVFGTVKGVFYGVLRTLGGGYDTATFLIPPYDKPVMEPEFVFEDWE